jgi:hypothetical protein
MACLVLGRITFKSQNKILFDLGIGYAIVQLEKIYAVRRTGVERFGAFVVLLLPVLALPGCGGLTSMQDSLNKFGSGTTTASTTEIAFLQNVQAFDCTTQFYTAATEWAGGTGQNYDISGTCNPEIITADQLSIRKNILSVVSLYASKIQALASTSGDKTLDTAGQKLAEQLNKAALSGKGITKSDKTIAAGVEGALIQLTNTALDQTRYNDARKAASDMQPYLTTVINALENENTDLAQEVQSRRGLLELSLRGIIDTLPKGDPEVRFDAVVNARQLLITSNPFGQETISSAQGPPIPDATALNSALDAVLSANLAISTASKGGIAAAVTDLVSRAQAAEADEAAIAK